MKKGLRNRETIICIGLLAAALFLCYLPYMQRGLYTGLDSTFHLARLESLADSLKNGVFPVKVHSEMCFGYGYGTGFFYSDIPLYGPALLLMAGVPLGLTYKIFQLAIMAAVLGTSFYAVWRLTGKAIPATGAAVTVLLSARMLDSVYHVASLGHTMAMIFVPLAIVGCWLLLQGQKTWLLSVGFIGLLLTHTISAVMAAMVCAVLIIFSIDKIIKAPVIIGRFLVSALVAVASTITWWLPMLEQMAVQTYKVSQPWVFVSENVCTWRNLFAGAYGSGVVVTIVLLSVSAYIAVRLLRRGKVSRAQLTMTGASLVITGLTMWPQFWRVMQPVLNFMQFPYRLYFMTTVLTALAFGLAVSEFLDGREQGKARVWIGAAAILAVLISSTVTGYRYFSEPMFTGERELWDDRKITQEVRGVGGGAEWLPAETSGNHFDTPTVAYDNEGSGAEGAKEKGDTIFSVYLNMEKEYYDMPYVYYYGYQAYRQDGTPLTVVKSGRDGLVRVLLPEGGSGVEQITVVYRKTVLQKAAYLLFGAWAAGAAAVLLYRRFGKTGCLRKREWGNRADE